MTQTLIGTGALAAVLSAAVGLVIPDPPAIDIHRLEWSGDMVTQERTVRGDGDAFYMAWAAGVFDVDTGNAVPQCEGSGAFPYPIGTRAVQFDLARWTGADGCTFADLPPGRYILRATYSWGDRQTSAQSNILEVTE